MVERKQFGKRLAKIGRDELINTLGLRKIFEPMRTEVQGEPKAGAQALPASP
jgi:hypothetical protein